MASAITAQKVDLGNLTLEGQMASALFGLAPTPVDPASVFRRHDEPAGRKPELLFFGGGTTTGLPSTSLSAFATSYLAQQRAASGSLVNATA